MNKIKFSLLPVGSTFTHQGEVYTKTSPLLANCSSDGKQRMVPRSAIVVVEDAPADAKPDEQPSTVTVETVKYAFDTFYSTCKEHLHAAGLDDNHPAIQKIDLAQERFIQEITSE